MPDLSQYNGQRTIARHTCGGFLTYHDGGLYCERCEEPSRTSPPSTPFVKQETSLDAAHFQSRTGRAATDEERVLRFIRDRGGATDDDIEIGLKLRHQTASARRNGLVRKGLVVATGAKRKTRTGCKAMIWRVAS